MVSLLLLALALAQTPPSAAPGTDAPGTATPGTAPGTVLPNTPTPAPDVPEGDVNARMIVLRLEDPLSSFPTTTPYTVITDSSGEKPFELLDNGQGSDFQAGDHRYGAFATLNLDKPLNVKLYSSSAKDKLLLEQSVPMEDNSDGLQIVFRVSPSEISIDSKPEPAPAPAGTVAPGGASTPPTGAPSDGLTPPTTGPGAGPGAGSGAGPGIGLSAPSSATGISPWIAAAGGAAVVGALAGGLALRSRSALRSVRPLHPARAVSPFGDALPSSSSGAVVWIVPEAAVSRVVQHLVRALSQRQHVLLAATPDTLAALPDAPPAVWRARDDRPPAAALLRAAKALDAITVLEGASALEAPLKDEGPMVVVEEWLEGRAAGQVVLAEGQPAPKGASVVVTLTGDADTLAHEGGGQWRWIEDHFQQI